eukprot:symbB.v1.2.015062.t1/scaffold1116.1/size136988/5
MSKFREIIGTFRVTGPEGTEKVIIAIKNGSIDLSIEGGHLPLRRTESDPCLPRWVKPGDGPSKLELHLRGECRPCLFHTRKADGCRKGNACEHCHICTASEVQQRCNRVKAANKRARAAATAQG